jgi:hypothetical protein
VKTPSDLPAATAAKALGAALKKDGWYDVRILGLTDVIRDPDDVPRDAFEQAAAKKLLASDASYEEVVETEGKRYLRRNRRARSLRKLRHVPREFLGKQWERWYTVPVIE